MVTAPDTITPTVSPCLVLAILFTSQGDTPQDSGYTTPTGYTLLGASGVGGSNRTYVRAAYKAGASGACVADFAYTQGAGPTHWRTVQIPIGTSAVSEVQHTEGYYVSAGTYGFTYPAPVSAGTLLIAALCIESSTSINPPDGWTTIYSDSWLDRQPAAVAIFGKCAIGDEGAEFGGTIGGGGGPGCAIAVSEWAIT